MEVQWPLILFTTLLAWSAGLFATQGLYAYLGKGSKAQMPAWITSAVLLVVGGIAVFFHLQHWERIFNGFGQINSGITQELIAIVVLAVFAIVYLVFLRKADDENPMPKWVAIVLIVLSVVLVAVMAHSYMMASRPAWNSIFWVTCVIGNACAFGPCTWAVICGLVDKVPEGAGKVALIGTAINAVTAVAYALNLQFIGGAFHQIDYHVDPTAPMQPIADPGAGIAGIDGSSLYLLWLGAVLVGAVAPLIIAFFANKKGLDWKVYGSVCVILVLIGALCMRVVFYQMGLSVFMLY